MRLTKYLFLFLICIFLGSNNFINAANLPDFSSIAMKVGPAVVNISTERKSSSGNYDYFEEMFKNLPPGFEKFFDQFHEKDKKDRKRAPSRKEKSQGSGFIISADGYIVTNHHVIDDADSIIVTLDQSNGKSSPLKATLVGSDEETDLALLKVDAKKSLPYLPFGDSDALKVGEWLLAIGNPFGLDHTVTAGILSAKDRNIRSGPFDSFLQTDASINPGNSGGPLLNMDGQVIGINTAIIARGQGLGFAIPSNMASNIINQIKAGKKISRGWLGVSMQDVDDDTAKALGMSEPKGALVVNVIENDPAAKAGMKDGDIIIKVNDKDIDDSASLLKNIANLAPNSVVKVTVLREGKQIELNVTLGERKVSQNNSNNNKKQSDESMLGLSVRPLKDDERKNLKITNHNEGLMIVGIDSNKPAADADIRRGDVILKANLKPVNSIAQLSKIVKEEGVKRGAVMLQILRKGETVFRTIPLEK